MAVILNIETSTNVCSVALTAEGMILCHFEDFQGQNHAAVLSGFIKRCLDHASDHEMKIDAVAVSMGPGSYTGLRIGLSEAKGLAFALDVPLIGVDTLQLMAVSVMFSQDVEPDTLFAPMIDARRMEVYTALYDMSLQPLIAPQPLILTEQPLPYDEYLAKSTVLFFGNGSNKAREVITSPNARFIDGIHPLATDMIALAERDYMQRKFIDLAYSTPNYLKSFQATKPKLPFC
ncbi:MAG: tRNA (adenosine(37)-N6)-threonylcarbamoyltransferase complex dimerization subunit type 1 TsaB [Bacteroides sp.]|nr:tRNA (adenosine(37)-N6)-threonylcarbamoyltransferase complex dimerization subunit type 1 TsaB [Bacteroides sp.]MCM1413371.1 tRNA (adenosine(37)-N6)-threonylcarbamoyltransferase complex dimerization subunit type 1 TsaB [Bacteroides sp.]MCM1471943.1 tRNA (adenosine(37)-N6)-threonylcarbamoyltransferase complex dimerization subunit type 1 TsaB [Bacteroides sp.]